MQIPRYISLKEKEEIFGDRYIRIDKSSDLKLWQKKHDVDFRARLPYLFRGVKEASYKNYTSAQRFWFVHDFKDRVTPQQLVSDQIVTLKDAYDYRLEAYCMMLDIPLSDLYALSFSQHYGGISPLLDFTESINTSLFFMTHGAEFPQNGEGSNEEDSIDNYMSLYYINTDIDSNFDSVRDLSNSIFEQYKNDTKFMHYGTRQSEMKESFRSMFTYPEMQKRWANSNRHLIVNHCLHYQWLHDDSYEVKMLIGNLNSVSQQSQFLYSDNGIKPMERGLYCVDIHKALVPFIRDVIIPEWRYSEQSIYPKPEEIVAEALHKTLLYAIDSESRPQPKSSGQLLNDIINIPHISR